MESFAGPASRENKTNDSQNQSIVPSVYSGMCHAFFAYDVGQAINLDRVERSINESKERIKLQKKGRSPTYLDLNPSPLKITLNREPVEIAGFKSDAAVGITLYDFGAVSVAFRFPVSGELKSLCHLSESLYENKQLMSLGQQFVEVLFKAIKKSIRTPHLSGSMENYSVFQIHRINPELTLDQWVSSAQASLAKILRSDREDLSSQEQIDALHAKISYTSEDVSFVDWSTSVIVDSDSDDVLSVLEYVNVALLELRLLDSQLDTALDDAYQILSRQSYWSKRFFPGGNTASLRRLGRLQVDSALLFEDVHNTLKLVGDQYLSRVYRIVSERFRLGSWNSSIQRKLDVLEKIYQIGSDRQSSKKMELLEWIIIVLIAVSIGIAFVPGLGH